MVFGVARFSSVPIGLLVLVLVFCIGNNANAVIETYEFSDSALHLRYKQLSAELRCPKCQNQNIADSDAPIARDLRKVLHRQLEAGASDEEIKSYMVARYGEFVLYRPRFEGVTLFLWLFPLLLLLVACLVLYRIVKKAKNSTEELPLIEDAQDFEAVIARKIEIVRQPESKS